jgi:hypothetical protein
MKKILLLLFLSLFLNQSFSQDSLKTFKASRTTNTPKIDGILDDAVWRNSETASGFIQNFPYEGKVVSQKTEVRISYDDYAIYVGAMMYDTAPDSILHELGNRDDQGLNADKFRFLIDPYNTRQDAYDFGVYSSGVQMDSRFSDETYNGVWQSAVKIISNGWSVEIRIPYSTIRFPKIKDQKWGLQFTRDLRRKREFNQWCLTPSGQSNPQKFWGTLNGITDIQPPIRLSLTPYISSYIEKAPKKNSVGDIEYLNSYSYNAGADIKYGLDERFTLDMTLLPDFGQVQSDNKVKNLSYREVTFEDYRPFFNEGTELFNKDAMFYSRRIGKTPSGFSSLKDHLLAGETIKNNPSQAKLLNATKISGRGNNGLGLGFLNAVTDNTYAEIKNPENDTRKLLTEPLTNYNTIAFDKQLKNASNVYLINTNVIRSGYSNRDANVTGVGFSLQNKKNSWTVVGSTNVSYIFKENTTQSGLYYLAGIGKISGKLQYSLVHEAMNNTFDRSDMGFQSINNYSSFNGKVGYNVFKPWKFLLRSNHNFNVNYSYNYMTGLPTNFNMNFNLFGLTKKNWGIWCGGSTSPVSSFDYFEPRIKGKYFKTAEWYYSYAGISTNYQKKFAIDIGLNTSNFFHANTHNFPELQGYGIELKPRFRASDKLSFFAAFNYSFDPFNPGYVDTINVTSIFGARELNTYENTLTIKYIFKNNLSLSIKGRHYWATGRYKEYYTLLDNGLLAINNTYSNDKNFSDNFFNIDAVFSWQFSPGSMFSVVYKNAIEKGETMILNSYKENFSTMLQSPQTNSLSFKVLYFLDYQQIKRKNNRTSRT